MTQLNPLPWSRYIALPRDGQWTWPFLLSRVIFVNFFTEMGFLICWITFATLFSKIRLAERWEKRSQSWKFDLFRNFKILHLKEEQTTISKLQKFLRSARYFSRKSLRKEKWSGSLTISRQRVKLREDSCFYWFHVFTIDIILLAPFRVIYICAGF